MKHKAREVKRLHRKAMEYADEADILRLEGDRDQFLHFTRLALENETAAALMEDEKDIEPTRSVLYRSAATLAYRCEMYVEAKRLIHTALGGYPPLEIEFELNDLLSKIKFALAGIELNEHTIQLGLEGKEVGYGTASTKEFASRITAFEELIKETVKVRNRQERYSPKIVEKAEGYRIYQGETKAASFIVHLTLGRPRESLLPGLVDFEQVFTLLVRNLSLIQDGDYGALETLFGSPADYGKFVKAATSFAPDGDKISSVNLQAKIENQVARLFFKRSKAELRDVPMPDIPEEAEEIQVALGNIIRKGVLKVADDDLESPICVLVTENREKWNIEGPEEIIESIGRSFWRSVVEVKGKNTSKSSTLKVIEVDDVANIREVPSGRNQASFAFL